MYYNVISERIAKNLRSDLFQSLIRKDVEFFDSMKSGDLCMETYYYHHKLIPFDL